jgi:pimeloyl-ACP methyl ester carboxylesterase
MAEKEPLIVREQGSFMTGGVTKTASGKINYENLEDPSGQTLHGDHAYVSYQLPVNENQNPLVFLHGALSSGIAWGMTPDGREGFDTLFLRKGYGVYLADQPRRGKAGRSTVDGSVSGTTDDQLWYHTWRVGTWPKLREGSQFPEGAEAMDQFLRWMTPNTGNYDEKVIADAIAALFEKLQKGILVTHSQGGDPGWRTAILSDRVQGVIAFEPGNGFVFPEGEVPDPIPSLSPFGPLSAADIPIEEFERLTKMPICIYYGDFIPWEASTDWPQDHWRARREMAVLFAECINRHGGNAKVISLPDAGITGNSHFLFLEKNNTEIAELMDRWIRENHLV